jgi:hypothetical protein
MKKRMKGSFSSSIAILFALNRVAMGMMSFVVKFMCVLIPVLPIGCAEFSTSFEEIEENRVRTIDFTYKNLADTALCEAAPGDSMEITALFAGEIVQNIDMSISFDVVTTLYGQSKSSNKMPLDHYIVYSSLNSEKNSEADTFTFRFAVPQSMLKTSSFLPEENWVGELPKEFQPVIDPVFAAKTKTEMVSLIETFAENHERWYKTGAAAGLPVDTLFTLYKTAFVPFAETYLQIFSALFELTVKVNGKYNVISQGTVRYHRKFGNHIHTVNKNPRINEMGIYRVYQNNLTYFDPNIHSQAYEKIVLFDRLAGFSEPAYTLIVRPNESYFLFASADKPQTTVSMYGAAIEETYMFEWFYQQNLDKKDTLDSRDLVSITNTADGPVVPLHVSESGVVKRCGVWVQVRDEAIGPRLFPTGSTVCSTPLFFSYSSDFTSK